MDPGGGGTTYQQGVVLEVSRSQQRITEMPVYRRARTLPSHVGQQ